MINNSLTAPHVWSVVVIVSFFACSASPAQSNDYETEYAKARNPEFWDWMGTQYQVHSEYGLTALSEVVSKGWREGRSGGVQNKFEVYSALKEDDPSSAVVNLTCKIEKVCIEFRAALDPKASKDYCDDVSDRVTITFVRTTSGLTAIQEEFSSEIMKAVPVHKIALMKDAEFSVMTGKPSGMLWIDRYDGTYKEQYVVTDMRVATTEKKTRFGNCTKAEDRKKMF